MLQLITDYFSGVSNTDLETDIDLPKSTLLRIVRETNDEWEKTVGNYQINPDACEINKQHTPNEIKAFSEIELP